MSSASVPSLSFFTIKRSNFRLGAGWEEEMTENLALSWYGGA